MAHPALIKAAVVLATDKRTWEAVGVVVAAVLTPFILTVIAISSMLNAAANHNNAAVRLTFHGGTLPVSLPVEYEAYVTEMRTCFGVLDGAIAEVEDEMEDGDSLDEIRVKSVFYVLYFGSPRLRLRSAAAREFVDCFVGYEECVHPAEEEGEEDFVHRRAFPLDDLAAIYQNAGAYAGRAVTQEDVANITEIYLRVTHGNFEVGADTAPEGGNGTHELVGNWREIPALSLQRVRLSVLWTAAGGTGSPRSLATAGTPPAQAAKGIPDWIWRFPWAAMSGR